MKLEVPGKLRNVFCFSVELGYWAPDVVDLQVKAPMGHYVSATVSPLSSEGSDVRVYLDGERRSTVKGMNVRSGAFADALRTTAEPYFHDELDPLLASLVTEVWASEVQALLSSALILAPSTSFVNAVEFYHAQRQTSLARLPLTFV